MNIPNNKKATLPNIILFSLLLFFLGGYDVSSIRSSSSSSAMAIAVGVGVSGNVSGNVNGNGNAAGRSASSLHVSNAMDITSISPTSDKRIKKKTAVIVGGGPAGLAAALVLSNVKKPDTNDNTNKEKQFFERVIVLDDAPNESYDPARAYFYNVNKRGQRFTDAFKIDLSKRGVGVSEFARHTVPPDPKDVFEGGNPFSRDMTEEERQQMGTMYWIPRHELVELITDEILVKNNNENNDNNSNNCIIEFRRGVRCEHVEPTEDGLVKIIVGDESDEDCIVADLCVGADGISSKVRQSLEDGRFDPEKWSNAKNPSKNFGLKKYISPSTGLRIKGLRLLPNFAIPKGGKEPDSGSKLPIDDRYNYGIKSITKGPTDSLSLVILPQKDPDSNGGRSFNICTMPDHDLWDTSKIRTDDGGASAKAYFTKAFPRFDWNQIVAENEWDLFASTKGSKFPPCQYSPSLYVSSNTRHEDDDGKKGSGSGSGVVLIGDALHAFPPDLGQGVNTAFCDAMVLGECFEDVASGVITANENDEKKEESNVNGQTTATTKLFIPEALKSYQNKNGPETRALIALARCGAPFQYNQPSAIMKFRKTLWTANIVLRLLLNKGTKGFSPKPAILLMMDSRLSFRQVMKRANTLTTVLWSSLLFVLLSLIRATIKA